MSKYIIDFGNIFEQNPEIRRPFADVHVNLGTATVLAFVDRELIECKKCKFYSPIDYRCAWIGGPVNSDWYCNHAEPYKKVDA